MANKTDLVIVESPSKAKTIGKYLGPGYEVKASMGHVRDLPKSKLSVDIEGGFVPDYQPIKGKEDVISDLKKAAKRSGKVYLATDPDREGEAISWHLKELLAIPDDKTYRVTFNEITKNVVNQSIAAPRAIDQNLVDAQQARRILDRIVGYQLSPLLWKKIRRGLSAGRVQSVATRLVVERELEIRAFVPQEYWSIEADLERVAPNLGAFKAQFHGREKKMELHSEAEAQAVMDAVAQGSWSVARVKRQEKNRQPAPPFTTSTLQQEASRKLNMSPARTMAVAQQLYEGVDIAGEGTVGLITYMRTDSLRLSEEALAEATKKGYLRPSIVDPLTRHNPGNNTGKGVPNIEYKYVPGQDYVDFIISFKGCGAELGNAMKIFTTATLKLDKDFEGLKRFVLETAVNAGGKPCPPFGIGIGIGGQMDIAGKLSREAISALPERGNTIRIELT